MVEMEGASATMYPAENGLIRVPCGRPASLSIDPRRTDLQDMEQLIVDVVGW